MNIFSYDNYKKILNEENINKFKQIKDCLILLNKNDSYFCSDSNCLLYVNRPRREYAKILDFILKSQSKQNKKYILKDGYYIDESVFIAHNCFIDKGSMIIANAEVSGSVHIGTNCWISPNSTIRDGITVGSNTIVGIGAVVVKNVDSNSVVVGNPVKKLI